MHAHTLCRAFVPFILPHQRHHMNTPMHRTWQYIKSQEKLNMFTMEISVHIDNHNIVILCINSMICVRGQQQCSLQPMCRLSGIYPGRIRGKPGLLSCSTITRRSVITMQCYPLAYHTITGLPLWIVFWTLTGHRSEVN